MSVKTVIFDIDGTICPIKKKEESYEDLIPSNEMVLKIRKLKEEGYRIVFFTARNMNTYKGDLSKILQNTAPIVYEWLDKWDIPYDEVIFGKAWPGHNGLYVDDRTVRPNEFMAHTYEELIEICQNSKIGG